MTTRDYEGDGIIVHWDSERCMHSQHCTAGLPAVFDRARRPWVDSTGASAGEIAAVIDTCPSGALTYTRTDGAAHGPRGRAAGEDPTRSLEVDPAWRSRRVDAPEAIGGPPDGAAPSPTSVTITPLRDGPLSISGSVVIRMPDGSTEIAEHWELCRCGHSASKPRCDGSHLRVGFVAPGAESGEPTDT